MDDHELPYSHPVYLWRHLAHREFDTLWQGKRRLMSRTEAYMLGRQLLDWPSSQELHIRHLDEATCQRLIAAVQAWRTRTRGRRTRPKRAWRGPQTA